MKCGKHPLQRNSFPMSNPLRLTVARRAATPYSEGMSDVTQILGKIESGDQQASEALLPLIYTELRRLAAARMAHEKSGQTLQATALVHEAYIRLVARHKPNVRRGMTATTQKIGTTRTTDTTQKTGTTVKV
jgi:hypothetical protein